MGAPVEHLVLFLHGDNVEKPEELTSLVWKANPECVVSSTRNGSKYGNVVVRLPGKDMAVESAAALAAVHNSGTLADPISPTVKVNARRFTVTPPEDHIL